MTLQRPLSYRWLPVRYPTKCRGCGRQLVHLTARFAFRGGAVQSIECETCAEVADEHARRVRAAALGIRREAE